MDLNQLPADTQFLLTDVDDTLTTHGRLLPATLQALFSLQEAGIKVIPVTGGCAGWCDQIVRLWPVEAVIGENGAFVMQQDGRGGIRLHSWQSEQERRRHQQALLQLAQQVMELVPALQLAQDQPYRLADVALDYNQRVSGVSLQEVQKVLAFCTSQGVSARASSIHINIWRGDYSKLAMAQKLLQREYGLTQVQMQTQVLFVGDAPNDEEMFGFFHHSFGVANIQSHLSVMQQHPRYLLDQPGGLGFAQLSELLLKVVRQVS